MGVVCGFRLFFSFPFKSDSEIDLQGVDGSGTVYRVPYSAFGFSHVSGTLEVHEQEKVNIYKYFRHISVSQLQNKILNEKYILYDKMLAFQYWVLECVRCSASA